MRPGARTGRPSGGPNDARNGVDNRGVMATVANAATANRHAGNVCITGAN